MILSTVSSKVLNGVSHKTVQGVIHRAEYNSPARRQATDRTTMNTEELRFVKNLGSAD